MSSSTDNAGFPAHRFSVAPMMDWSDRHCRYFWRLLSKNALLYTEMVTTGALLHASPARFLNFSVHEQPLALQLGGSEPSELAQCTKMANDWGYQEVNLNCGCPSDRVQNGKIGACLMAEPETVANCVKAMVDASSVRITVKHRLGIDDLDSDALLQDFVGQVAAAGCNTFIVHARKAWLKGLSPKANREIPPLQYERVYALKKCFPQLNIIINGGIKDLETCEKQLAHVDGVMMGREAYNKPYLLSQVDQKLFAGKKDNVSRDEVLEQFAQYCAQGLTDGTRLHHMSRHIYGLYSGQKGAKLFRRYMSDFSLKASADEKVLYNARLAMNTHS